MKKETIKTVSIVALFAIAMAFLESVIVYYIRLIYYHDGFSFPLVGFIEPAVLNVEIAREIFTLVMLLCIALLSAKTFYERFAYFWFAFAVWDIFYYIWLKVILNWPSSLLTWDILFLIPWSWASPVLAPVMSSLTMILLSFSILYILDNRYKLKIKPIEWFALFTGAFFQLYTFLYDYGKILFEGNYFSEFLTLATNERFIQEVGNYIPTSYNWTLFIIGEVLLITAIISWHARSVKAKKELN